MMTWLLSLLVLPLVAGQWDADAGAQCGAADGASAGGTRGPVDPSLASSLRFADLPGFTRSTYKREYALIAPESRVYAPLPGWRNVRAAVLASPALGAHFTMALISLAANASASALPPPGVERLVFVLDGHVDVTEGAAGWHSLNAGGYAYFPAGHAHGLESMVGASLLMWERRFAKRPGLGAPAFVAGGVESLPVVPCPGESFVLRKLLPESESHDFNVHVMDFSPGESLAVRELHHNQHGLLMLEGRGIYRLGSDWHPVAAGDAIYMAPFCPQWYAALGPGRTRYILYKDVGRDALDFDDGD